MHIHKKVHKNANTKGKGRETGEKKNDFNKNKNET